MGGTVNSLQASKKWGIPIDVVISLCDQNFIDGAFKFGDEWWIPDNLDRPSEECIHKATISLNKSIEDEKKIAKQREKSFNGLSASEWANHSRSVWNDVSSTREKKHLDHGATYPEKLCDRLIEMYSRQDDLVLDPFLGTGTTVISALKNKRKAVGIELTDRFYSVAFSEISSYAIGNKIKTEDYSVIQGDCSEILKTIDSDTVQLTITSPPYADLIHMVVDDRTNRHKNSMFVKENNATTNLYSSDDRDLGNMPLDQYIVAVEEVMKELFRVTRKGGYNVWVVKDFRDTAHKIPYIDLHSQIARAGEKAGFKYHDLIIWDQNERRKLVCLGYPSVFYVNQNHSYLVVMRK